MRTVQELRASLLEIFADVRGAPEAINAAAEAAHDDLETFICTLRDHVKHSDDLKHLRRGSRKKGTRDLLVKHLRYGDVSHSSISAEFGNPKSKDILGKGEFGDVYDIVEYPELSAVAKVDRPKNRKNPTLVAKATERFRRDAAVSRRLAEKGCTRAPAYLGGGTLPTGEKFFLMERVPGEDLETHLRRHGPLTPQEAAQQFAELAKTLKEMHVKAGIVHRDIKPANIKGGTIIDFGMAGAIEKDDELSDDDTINMQLTQAGEVLCTPRFSSPEQVLNSLDKKPRNDYYSLALSFAEALTGKPVRSNYKSFSQFVSWCQMVKEGKEQEDLSTLAPFPPEVEEATRALMQGDVDRAILILERLAEGGGNTLRARINRFGRRHPRLKMGGVILSLASLLTATTYGAYHIVSQVVEDATKKKRDITFPKNAHKSEDILFSRMDESGNQVKLLIRSGFETRQHGEIVHIAGTVEKDELYVFDQRELNPNLTKKWPSTIVERFTCRDPKTGEQLSAILFLDSRSFVIRGNEIRVYAPEEFKNSPFIQLLGDAKWFPANTFENDDIYQTIIQNLSPDDFSVRLFDKNIFKGTLQKNDDQTTWFMYIQNGVRNMQKKLRERENVATNKDQKFSFLRDDALVHLRDFAHSGAMDIMSRPSANAEFTLSNQLRLQKTARKGDRSIG